MSTIDSGHFVGLTMSKKRRFRRLWEDEEKIQIVAQTRVPGVSVSEVARRYDVNANLVFRWVRDPRFNRLVEDHTGPPPAKWSIPIVRRRRTNYGEQTTKTRGNCNQAATS